MKSSKSIKQLKKKLDQVFSKYIRIRDGFCITCGSKKNLQCGHYVSRTYNSLRWDERNCNAQCMRCNIFLGGNKDEYAIKLEEIYGKGILQELGRKKRERGVIKLYSEDLLADIKYYQSKYEELSK